MAKTKYRIVKDYAFTQYTIQYRKWYYFGWKDSYISSKYIELLRSAIKSLEYEDAKPYRK